MLYNDLPVAGPEPHTVIVSEIPASVRVQSVPCIFAQSASHAGLKTSFVCKSQRQKSQKISLEVWIRYQFSFRGLRTSKSPPDMI